MYVFTEANSHLAVTATHAMERMGPLRSYCTAPLVPKENDVNGKTTSEKQSEKDLE
jgi:hypothetical protein